MEPALDVLNRALLGDPGARSFLERTSSIYILDVTDMSKPKTYGCWNFIHQTMNEVERYEAAYMRSDQAHTMLNGAGLVHHVRLLASMALRVARRSPASDKKLVMTCIANSEKFDGTESQSQWLIDLNLELREIVMGRIAAMAFDFSFHRRVGEHGYSAFADEVVRDTLCAILSANAVASGPGAIRHFSTEWIIPSSGNLPAFALASVVLHLAIEGSRKTAPAGTKDMLQQLSVQVMSVVLVPILAESSNENTGPDATVALCFRAMTSWCSATDLSLAQIRHICNKVRIDVVGAINDSMYSDSPAVVDALAQLVESLVAEAVENPVPVDRMNQVRHIMQVDESNFQSRFSLDQLTVIESKEMEAIVGELGSAVGLQRFRFSERQNSGDHDVCRNLARIAASVCKVCVADPGIGVAVIPDPGIIELLHKAAGHPFVYVSAIALDGLIGAARRGYASAGALLPVLQRRAIIPHLITQTGGLTLTAYELCGVSFQEFESFRNGILMEFLLLCWRVDRENFIDSCTAAVEEFCFSQHLSPELSLQLEAALFCVEAVSREAMSSGSTIPHPIQLQRIVSAIGTKPNVIFCNPLTLSRMCCLIQQLSRWLAAQGVVSAATGLAIEAFRSGLAASARSDEQDLIYESGVSVVATSARALKELCIASPKDLNNEASLQSLGDAWKESCSSRHKDIDVADRLALCSGICSVIASLPSDRQPAAFESMASCLLDSLDILVSALKVSVGSQTFESGLSQLSAVVSVMASLPRTMAAVDLPSSDFMESGCDTSPDKQAKIPEAILAAFGRGWSILGFICENYSSHENVASSMCELLAKWCPPPPLDGGSKASIGKILSLANSMAKTGHGRAHFKQLFLFLEKFVHMYGEEMEKAAIEEKDFGCMVQDLIIRTVDAARASLGSAWSRPKEQHQGQQAFESKPSSLRVETVPNESLAGIFSFTTECLETCPVFLLHLPAGSGKDRDGDLFIRRATDSSVIALNDSDPVIVRSAMKLLKMAVLKATPQQNELQAFLSEFLSRNCADILARLLLGFCGKLNRELIGTATDLLNAILQEADVPEIEAHIGTCLGHEYFLLGDPVKNTVLSVFRRSTKKDLDSSVLTIFLQTIWELHQVEDTEALPNSESAARLIGQFES